MKSKTISFIAGMLFMVTFGIIDNAFLYFGMSINPFISMHSDPLLSAMWGNTFSDVIGAIAGVIIASGFKLLFTVKASEHFLVEISGVLIGCVIPIFIYIIF